MYIIVVGEESINGSFYVTAAAERMSARNPSVIRLLFGLVKARMSRTGWTRAGTAGTCIYVNTEEEATLSWLSVEQKIGQLQYT